jgi:hypothetical protein
LVSRSVGDAAIFDRGGIEHVYKDDGRPECYSTPAHSFLPSILAKIQEIYQLFQFIYPSLLNYSPHAPSSFTMISQIALLSLVGSMAAAQTLNIPTRSGNIVSLPKPSTITGKVDFANKEFDRGQPCDSDEDTGSDSAVFILQDGASISNVIIGADALEGVHCLGSCTLTNVWFRDVCEDAVSVLGPGNALIQGGGAQEAKDKVIQHKYVPFHSPINTPRADINPAVRVP